MAASLQEYDFTVQHIAGVDNIIADALSRLMPVPASAAAALTNDTVVDITNMSTMIASVHNSTTGHFGYDRTIKLLEAKNIEITSTIRKGTKKYLDSCAICQKTRHQQPHINNALHKTAVTQPYTTLHVDMIGPLPTDNNGNTHILAFIDCFTRFTDLFAVPNPSANSVVPCLLSVIGRYGMFNELRSDQGTNFTADIINQACSATNVTQRFLIPYRP